MSAGELARDLRRVRGLARVLDSAVRIPGTRVRFGADALLGLIPGLGDAVSALFAAFPLGIAVRHGLPASVLLRMLGNIGLDALLGSVPVLGDLFDIGFRANERNAALIERHIAAPERLARRSRLVLWLAITGFLALVLGLLALGVWIINGAFDALTR